MKRRQKNPGYFSKGNLIFWALILLWIGIQFLHLLDPLFDEARVTEKFRKLEAQERLESNLDSLRQIVRDSIEKKQPEPGCPVARYTWKWQDPFTGRNESMSFEICESEAQNAGNFRKNLRTADLREVYVRMSESDALPLNGMVQSFRVTIKSRGMGYEKALFFIVGAIQAIPYTLVLQGGGPLHPGASVLPRRLSRESRSQGLLQRYRARRPVLAPGVCPAQKRRLRYAHLVCLYGSWLFGLRHHHPEFRCRRPFHPWRP